jgi:hypothetical protein
MSAVPYTNNVVNYKWNPETCSGYRLRFDKAQPRSGLHRRYVVENWENLTIVDDWGCDTVEEAVRVLETLFEVNEQQEIESLRRRFEPTAELTPEAI